MGIYNCAETLEEALDCIVKQTYTNWEVIMCDDCSTDHTVKIAEKYVIEYPNQFVLLRNDENKGLNYTLNKCLEFADGDYIARMDGDDLCAEDRFEKEVEALRKNPEIAIVSTDMLFFDENGVWGKTYAELYPIKESFLKGTPFCHAACMVRKEAYEKVKGYSISDRLLRVEDYHLWIKMYEAGYRGKNIPKQLYLMRDDRAAYKRRKLRYRINEAYVKGIAIRKLGLPISGYLNTMRPILVGILPEKVYDYFHKRKLESNAGMIASE